jgi:perosamine synthetase
MMNIPWAEPVFWGEEKKFLLDALHSTWISGGPYVRKFEKDFARCHGVKFCITTSSGTTALQLALLGLGVHGGDEVLVPAFSFMAPVNMAMAVGAKPVYADIDPETWCLDPVSVARKISSRTKAMVAVHSYGNVCDMPALKRLAHRRGVFIVEDVAEAAFSRYQNKLAGTWGDVGCFSFQATKTIAMGEGGCVLTSNAKLHERMRLIRDHGMSHERRYWHEVLGYNFRLTNLQAALGCAQLRHLTRIVAARKKVYAMYRRYLTGEPGISLQFFRIDVDPVVWSMAVLLDPDIFGVSRDSVMDRLAKKGIETRPGFYTAAQMPFYKAPSLPVAEHVAGRVLCLPFSAGLTESQVRYVCDHLKKVRRQKL